MEEYKEVEDILYETFFTNGKMMLSTEIDSCYFHAMTHEDTEILGMFLDVVRPSKAEDLKRILIKGYMAWMKEK